MKKNTPPHHRLTVSFEKPHIEKLRKLAYKKRVTISEIIRQAVECFV